MNSYCSDFLSKTLDSVMTVEVEISACFDS